MQCVFVKSLIPNFDMLDSTVTFLVELQCLYHVTGYLSQLFSAVHKYTCTHSYIVLYTIYVFIMHTVLQVGTSSVVYPAAGFAPMLAARGVPVAEFNLEDTPVTGTLM